MKYYDREGYQNQKAFAERLEEIHNSVEDQDLNGLLKIRTKLYNLKRKYEESGRRYLDCEYEIMAVNELIAESK